MRLEHCKYWKGSRGFMGALLLMGSICLVWGMMGLMLIVSPICWIDFAKKTLTDPWKRFWVTQAMLLFGLVLIIGTAPLQGFWLWVGCGVIAVLKACLILGWSEDFLDRLAGMATTQSMLVYRISGFLALVLAFLLAADTIFHG